MGYPVRDDSFLITDLRFLLNIVKTPHQMGHCLDKLRHCAAGQWRSVLHSILSVSINRFVEATQYTRFRWVAANVHILDDWKAFIRKLIVDEGADIHQVYVEPLFWAPPDEPGEASVLTFILKSCECPFVLEFCLGNWLDILQSCGIDIQGYLEREVPYCAEHYLATDCQQLDYNREFCLEDFCGFLIPSWRRRIDPTCPAPEVFREHRYLSLSWGEGYSLSAYKVSEMLRLEDEGSQHRSWKRVRDGYWDILWPFLPSIIDPMIGGEYPVQWIRRCFEKRVQLAHQRFERRQMRKLVKAGVLKKRKKMMPGTWDENWQVMGV